LILKPGLIALLVLLDYGGEGEKEREGERKERERKEEEGIY
jgi:hypothetical protein